MTAGTSTPSTRLRLHALNLLPAASGLLFYLGAAALQIGELAFGFLVPALAGYIAYAIADRPGIAPGFVVGAVSGLPRRRASSAASSAVCSPVTRRS